MTLDNIQPKAHVVRNFSQRKIRVRIREFWFVCRVTLFGLHWLHAASASQWHEELYVPSDLVNDLAEWLALQQQPDGYYVEIATIYDPNVEVQIRYNQSKKYFLLSNFI